MSFPALVLSKQDQTVSAELTQLTTKDLPEGDVLVAVSHSTLNFKDGLAITNRSPVVRTWPMVAGIDGAGVVLESSNSRWQAGDRVLVNGWGLGETRWGCLAGQLRVPGEYLVAIPETMTAYDSMAIGTAGYTAMLSILALEQQGITPASGPVLVTGATGGVGSVAVAILAKLGYQVTAVTGKASEHDYLTQLGAAAILPREVFAAAGKPLQKEQWAAVVDCVGSHTLVNACAQTRYGGVVTSCGLAQGMDFPATVMPFILRAVRLIGVDSVMAPIALRQVAWQRLASDLSADALSLITAATINLGQVPQYAEQLMAGQIRGRVVVEIKS
ncbi:MAG: MDR family oxidoreductase [Moraxellaceae bacterium]|nr:MDR family oxidoreductase [Moraxellaceae bacterium]MDZ4387073.1 MDR family oxidoreductase [Moraxellaceae bacterium]